MEDPTVSMQGGPPVTPYTPVPPIDVWGPFQLLEKAGEGGFGAVYRARDTKLDREVAVKLLLTGQGSDEDYSAIIREARLMARVRHPNIVSVYGVERYEGRVGFWSDFVRGKTLSDLCRTQGPFGAREAALIGIELCRALSAMHAAGLLHRDIKASNAMREEGGRILLMDFGLSGELSTAPALGGTRGYMAPELYKGLPASVASDIYALGILLYYIASGHYPDDTPSTRRRLIDERPDLPESFARVVETAIDPDPAKRFPSAGAMLSALSELYSEPLIIAAPKRRWLVPAAIALVLAAAGFGYYKLSPTASGANEDYIQAMALLQREDKPENVDKATALFEKTIAADPKSALAHSGLARAELLKYRATKDPTLTEKARIAAQKAVQLNGDLASVHVTAGSVYTSMNRYDLATNELGKAIKLDPTSAEAYAELAGLYSAQGRTDEVVPEYRKAIDLGPEDWRWLNRLGNYYLSKGKNAEAAELYKRVVGLVPDNAFGYSNLGIAYFRQERYSEAEDSLRRALKLNPKYANALLNLGNTLLLEGKYDEAAQQYQQALALRPGDYLLHGDLAAAYQWGSQNRDKAKKEWLETIDLAEQQRKEHPRSPILLARLGSFYAAVGTVDRALPLLRQAVALSPEDPDLLVAAGEGFEIIGDRREALEAIGKALELGFSPRYVERDPDLLELRKDPKFLAFNRKVR